MYDLPSLCHILQVIHICLWNKQVVTFDDLIATFIPSFHTCLTIEQKVTNFKQLFKPQGVGWGYSQNILVRCVLPTQMWNMKIKAPLKAQTLKMRPSSREKRKLRIKENTKNFHELLSLDPAVKFSFNRWFVSGITGHLRSWILADRITVPFLGSTQGT